MSSATKIPEKFSKLIHSWADAICAGDVKGVVSLYRDDSKIHSTLGGYRESKEEITDYFQNVGISAVRLIEDSFQMEGDDIIKGHYVFTQTAGQVDAVFAFKLDDEGRIITQVSVPTGQIEDWILKQTVKVTKDELLAKSSVQAAMSMISK